MRMKFNFLDLFIASFASAALLGAVESSVPAPTNGWRYVYCGMSGGDVALQLEFSIDGVAQQHRKELHFLQKSLREQPFPRIVSDSQMKEFEYQGPVICVAGPVGFSAAGTSTGAPIKGINGAITPGQPTDQGVQVSLRFHWIDRDAPHELSESVFVSYQGTTTYTNGPFSLKGYFQTNQSVAPTTTLDRLKKDSEQRYEDRHYFPRPVSDYMLMAKHLTTGMSPVEVENILGAPTTKTATIGEEGAVVWIYELPHCETWQYWVTFQSNQLADHGPGFLTARSHTNGVSGPPVLSPPR